MKRMQLSVIAEWVKNRKYLNSRLLISPVATPKPTEKIASSRNSPPI